MAKIPGLSRSDTLLAVTTISFDIAGLELYLPLLVGAQVVIADRETAMDGVLLKQIIGQHGVTVMQATPTTWRLLLEAGWSGNTSLQRAFCGGEGFPSDLAQQMLGLQLEVWNLYGPTETTIWSTAQRVVQSALKRPNEDIGYPIDNTTVYVVDQDCNLMPQSASGELLIGGDGLAWGYLGLPALTAEKFIPDPFGTTPGARLYKTGDRARRLADGTLTCLGRIDHQIKIRGFRIEPGEIEVVIQQHSSVRQAVVIVWTAEPGDKRLAAYFTSKDSTTTIDAVKDWTRAQLPAHMVPTEWAQLEQLPLTPNGKLDRNALPAPGASSLKLYVPPLSETEVALATLMAEVLGIELVSCDDDFFDLGGHSLLAGRLVTKIQKVLQVQIPLAVLFDKPCVNVLAKHLDTQRWLVQQQAQPLAALTDDEEEFRL
jgi:acyl-coenzyme A synthetase/AMP-(fatty) acid ligase/acyl carrier protein